jgi:hypothetical protein
VGHFEKATLLSSLKRQALYSFRYLYKFQAWKMSIVAVTLLDESLYFPTPIFNRRLVK